MKAAVFYSAHDLRVEDTPVANLGEKDVLIRVHACGICGTDVHIFHGDEGAAKTPAGTALGHEFAGEVVQVGEQADPALIGVRAAIFPLIPCRKCDPCVTGNYAMCEDYDYLGSRCDGGSCCGTAAPGRGRA